MAQNEGPVPALSFQDILQEKVNFWRNELADRCLKWNEAMIRFRNNPGEVIKTQGGAMSLIAILDLRVQPVKEARACLQAAEEMLADAGDQPKLEHNWSDEALTVPQTFTPETVA